MRRARKTPLSGNASLSEWRFPLSECHWGGGRRKRLDRNQRAQVVDLYRSREHTVKQICKLMGISRATLYAYVEEFSKQP